MVFSKPVNKTFFLRTFTKTIIELYTHTKGTQDVVVCTILVDTYALGTYMNPLNKLQRSIHYSGTFCTLKSVTIYKTAK